MGVLERMMQGCTAEAFASQVESQVFSPLRSEHTQSHIEHARQTLEILYQQASAANQCRAGVFPKLHKCLPVYYEEAKQRFAAIVPTPDPEPVVPLPEPPKGSWLVLGEDAATGSEIRLSRNERMYGTYIVGLNGTGKTTLIEHMIAQDMEAGHGICLLDPHGDVTNHILDRVPEDRLRDVIILDMEPNTMSWGINLFACPDPTDPSAVSLTIDSVLHAFEKLFGDMEHTIGVADLLTNLIVTFVATPGTTMADIPRFLTDEGYRQRLVSNVPNPAIRDYWQLEYDTLSNQGKQTIRQSTLRRLRTFLSNPMLYNLVSQPESSVDFTQVMEEGKILLVQFNPKLPRVVVSRLGRWLRIRPPFLGRWKLSPL